MAAGASLRMAIRAPRCPRRYGKLPPPGDYGALRAHSATIRPRVRPFARHERDSPGSPLDAIHFASMRMQAGIKRLRAPPRRMNSRKASRPASSM
ncbi:hypothetical protein PSP6_320104 [Paraburkholderia tropica]|nr:hypothetical protein PSP6_320104 [Paraburkholderia tropica]